MPLVNESREVRGRCFWHKEERGKKKTGKHQHKEGKKKSTRLFANGMMINQVARNG